MRTKQTRVRIGSRKMSWCAVRARTLIAVAARPSVVAIARLSATDAVSARPVAAALRHRCPPFAMIPSEIGWAFALVDAPTTATVRAGHNALGCPQRKKINPSPNKLA